MKKLIPMTLIGSALLLASCNSTQVVDIKVPSTLTTLSGTVVEGEYKTETTATGESRTLITKPWTGGTGTIVGTVYSQGSSQNLTVAELAADGKFSLDLKTPSDDLLTGVRSDYSDLVGRDAQCQGTINVGTASVRGTSMVLSVKTDTRNSVVFPRTQSTVISSDGLVGTMTEGELTYVDQGVTLKGIQTCSYQGQTVDVDIDMTLRKGWNKVTLTFKLDTKANTGTVMLRSGNFAADNWVYMNASSQPLSVQGLKSLHNFSFFR